ncbi:adenosylcobinamide-phosphate synthase CbiB [Lachnospiraceae bacterium ZAX-1]
MYIVYSLCACMIGFLLDLILGDPKGWWHPVKGMGWLIDKLEKWLRRKIPKSPSGEFLGGIVLVLVVCGLSTAIPLVLLFIFYNINDRVGFVLEAIMCYAIMATKSLKVESMEVYHALEEGPMMARRKLSMIVGRDTERLNEAGIIKATVETIAENTSDGSIAPLMFLMLGGPTLGFFYKAINTMDSMVGYKNDTYRYFGTAAAKTDDVVNWIPARFAARIMILASALQGFDAKNAMRIYRRDKTNHASPNAAHTEAVMAGAFGIKLAGDAWYFGQKHTKPTIGDFVREVSKDDIVNANHLLYGTAILAFFILFAIKLFVIKLMHIPNLPSLTR